MAGAGIGNALAGICSQFPPADPDADKLLYWNNTTNEFDYLGVGTNLSISGGNLNASGGGGGAVDSVNGQTGVVVLDTGDISESGNLYFTDERAQDAVGGIVDSTLIYTDGTPVLKRAPITGDVGIPDGSNTATISGLDASKIADGSVSNAEYQYLNGVTSAIQTQINNCKLGGVGITIDGGGSAITTGVKGYIMCPYAGTITGWTILGDTTGSIVVDVWKDTYANFPPTVADTIAGSEKPTISTSNKGQDNSLSTWTTTVSAGDIFGFNVDSASTLTRVQLFISITRT